MAMKDYNSSSFRNAAIDRLNGKFGKGPGDGLKSASTSSATSTGKGASGLLTNPWGNKPQPLVAVKAPTTDKTSLKTPNAKPSTTVSTTVDKTTASSTAPKTLKDVRKENKMKKAQAKGESAVSRINKKANMTAEDKAAKKERFGSTLKKVGAGIGSAALGAIEILNATEDYRNKKSNNKQNEKNPG